MRNGWKSSNLKGHVVSLLTLGGAIVLGAALSGEAAVVTTLNGPTVIDGTAGEGGPNSYSVSNTDLVNAGQSTLSGVSYNPADVYGTLAANGMLPDYANDGQKGYVNGTNNSGGGFGFKNNGTLTFNLNTTLNPLGYEISSINVLSGFDGRRISHNYKVEFAYVDNPSLFIAVAQVGGPDADTRNQDSGKQGTRYEIQSILSDTSGVLGTGVAAIRFTFWNDNSGETVYHEIDVFGSVVAVAAPAPAALPAGLGLLGLAALGARRRK